MPVCPKCRQTGPEVGAPCPRDDYYFVEPQALEGAGQDRRLGTLVGDRFIILDQISQGGMGAVYRALQLPVRRQVALKVLRAELEQSHKVRKRFIREARAISQLSHPNVITLHDFGFDEYDQPYMVMEYAPGEELCDWARDEGVTTRRLVDVVRQLLSALAEAHAQGIVHRDLKPQNVIVTRTGQNRDFPKLLDFGIARLVNRKTTQGLTADGEVFGTPHYMSPEQARGAAEVGPESDVYAMGVILYECCTGDVPFDADSPLSVLFMHLNEPMPEPVPRQGLDLPEGLAQVIYRATEKEAEDRYGDAGEMLAAFDEALGLMSETGSFSLSGQFPSTASADQSAPSEDDEVARAATMMMDDDQWGLEVVDDGRSGSTLRSHQFDDEDEAAEEDSPPASAEAASPPTKTPSSEPVKSKESSSPPWGLILLGGGVAAMLIIGIGAVLFVGLSAADDVDGGEEAGEEPQLAAAEEPEGEEGSGDDETTSAEADGESEPVELNEGDVLAAAEADEESEGEDEEDTDAAEPDEDRVEPVGAAGDDGGGARTGQIDTPEAEEPTPPAESAQPPSDEPADEPDSQEASEEEEDDAEEFEPGVFERPSRSDDDGPTKFQRPGQIGESSNNED